MSVFLIFSSAVTKIWSQAPTITVDPTNRVSVIGGSALMSVTASGAPPLSYLWIKDGTFVARATNRLLLLSNLALPDAGGYAAVVTNAFGTATSRVAFLSLTGAPPVVYQEPIDSTACSGLGARLSVGIFGSPPLRYQWFFGGEPIPNATSWTHTVETTLLGDYFAVVRNDFGMVTSGVARVAVGPRILVQPVSREVTAGTGVEFSVVVQACPETRFQWRWNGLTITNATNSTLRYGYPNPTGDFTGDFDVVVFDNFGAITSAVARLTVNEIAPSIIAQPEDLIEPPQFPFHPPWTRGVLSFSVGFNGTPRPAFQWYFNGVALPGGTNQTLGIVPEREAQGYYHVVLTNGAGRAESRRAEFRLRELPPVIDPLEQPRSVAVCPPIFPTNSVVLSVGLTTYGWAPLGFQWFREGQVIPDATNRLYILPRMPDLVGDYVVVVTNGFGSVTSDVARVSSSPIIVGQPPEWVEEEAGGYATFPVELSVGCTQVTFQWQRDGMNIPGATSEELVLGPLSTSDSGDYRLVARWNSGSITTAVSRLEVTVREPWISDLEPDDQAVNAGDWVIFDVTGYDLGAPAGTFQWLFNGVPIPGATDPNLSFIAEGSQQQGRYALVLSNEFGSATSRVATVKVLYFAPYFDVEPEDLVVPSGTDATFWSSALGAPPPTYQWLRDGVPIRGQTNEYLNFIVRGTNDLTGYAVVASNILGMVTSRVATVHVELYPPYFQIEPASIATRAGVQVYLYCIAAGAPPPEFQWFFDGNPVAGETNQFLQFTAGFSNQIGGYSVVASNVFGAVTSQVARLDIELDAPEFTFNPRSASLLEGEPLLLQFALSNQVPVLVQWQKDEVDLTAGTDGIYSVRTTTTNDSGAYRVIVWNDVGRATSLVAQVSVRRAGPLDRWTWRRPLPQGNDLRDVAGENGRWTAVGDVGGVVTSTNGVDWADSHTVGRARYRSSIAAGNGIFVSLGGSLPEVSSNGVDWVDVTVGPGVFFYALAFGSGRFVAICSSEQTAVSTNGVDWEFQHVPELAGWAGGLSFANGLFFAPVTDYGDDSNFPDSVLVSGDGVTWTLSASRWSLPITDVTYGQGLYMAIQSYPGFSILVSTNGLIWTEKTPTEPMDYYPGSIAFASGVFVAQEFSPRGNGLAWSTNATDWNAVPGIGTNAFRTVRTDGTRFVAVGYEGTVATSANGRDWTVVSPGSELNFRGLATGNGVFVAVGNLGTVFTSTDGREWLRRESGATNNLRGVTWFGDRFVVVGGTNDTGNETSVLTSSDGVAWRSHPAQGELYSVAHDGRRLVAVGDRGVIVTSLDGISWERLPEAGIAGVGGSSPTTKDLNAITWTGRQFLVAGKDGTVIASEDGLNWESVGPGGGRNLHGIAYGNGVYVAVGNGGRFYVSEDRRHWKRGDLETTADFSEIAFAGGRFMAVGDWGTVFTSGDGTNWIRHVTVCENDLRSVAYSEGSFYAVGNNETILQCAQVDASLRLARSGSGQNVRVEIRGETGRQYRLQGSVDLSSWTDLLNFTSADGLTIFADDSPAAGGWRFYRVVSP